MTGRRGGGGTPPGERPGDLGAFTYANSNRRAHASTLGLINLRTAGANNLTG